MDKRSKCAFALVGIVLLWILYVLCSSQAMYYEYFIEDLMGYIPVDVTDYYLFIP